MKLIGISGSLRRRSYNAGLLDAVGELLPANTTLQRLDIRLPLYDADLDVEGGPPDVAAFKAAIGAADAVLIATPEYNYGIPGPLKNAIDWASRPAYRSPFAGKKTAILGASISTVGTARAQGQLKQVLLGMAAEVFSHPEVLVATAKTKFDAEGRLTDEATREALGKMVTAFVAWVGGDMRGHRGARLVP
jgi:chromate reductase